VKVKVDEDDLKKNLLHVTYDPDKVTTQTLLETVAKEGFEATIVSDTR
jgi:hypothetical protein